MTTTTFVTISCQRCRLNSTVPVDALLLTVTPDEPAAEWQLGEEHAVEPDRTAGAVAWACPGCDDLVSARLDWAALVTLVGAGATVLEDPDSAGDALLPHPENPAGGAPLTRDDLLALHELLASDTWFTQVCAAGCTNP